jgi:hypothetical protein
VTRRREQVRTMLDAHWVPEGYAAPNGQVYPWQWLWDSCFHSIIWAELAEPDRALVELASALSTQDAHGFVPHMNYVRDPTFHAAFWGRTGASSITQPPMYGHTIASLRSLGILVPSDTVRRARDGLRFLIERRRRHEPSNLVLLAHPWETGCDDSPRWDDLCLGDAFELVRWKQRKGELVEAVEADAIGSPIGNHAFEVASVGFNALVVFNAFELGLDAPSLCDALDERFDAGLSTWIDAGDTEHGSGRTRSLDGLLPVLVERSTTRARLVLETTLDEHAYGARYGPTGVHRSEPSFAPGTYWRGPTWPQLAYLLWVAARRHGFATIAHELAVRTVAGAFHSGLAEYWNPDTGEGLGAMPQSWTGLAWVMAVAEGINDPRA